jgi:hypothetical protein
LLPSSSMGPTSPPNLDRSASFQRSALVRLYQVLSPSHVLRGAAFGCKLSLKEEWACVDQPYFNAPGTCQEHKLCGSCMYYT